MKKEKTIRTYQRRTKTGKVVTVKQHTAKYDAAEALKEAAKKKGAGDELEALKKKPVEKPTEEEVAEFEKLLDSFPDGLDERERKMRLKQFMKAKGKEGRQAEIDETKWEIKEEKKARKVWKANEKFGKRLEKSYEKEHKKSDTSYGFTADEYKAWYHWDQAADPKNKTALKVEKALKKQMGTKAYNKYFDDLTDNYSARGHNKAFKALGEKLSAGEDKKASTSASTKSVTPAKETKSVKGPKESTTLVAHVDGDNSIKYKVTPTSPMVKDVAFTKYLADDTYSETFPKGGSYEFFYAKRNKGGDVGLYAKRGNDIFELEETEPSKALAKKLGGSSSREKKSPQEREAAFKEKHAAKVEEWKKNGNIAGLKKEIAGIRMQYGSNRKKADALVKPLEEAIEKAKANKGKSSKKAEAKRAKSSIEGLKDPKRDAAKKELERKDREYLKGVTKKAMFKKDPWFKRNGWTKQEKRNGNYSWISPDGNVSVPVTKLGMGAGKNFGVPKIKKK